MSRCFSFPPPEYTLSDERIGIMMELIKLKKEKEKRRDERRERRERKERRGKKEEKRREERRERRERKEKRKERSKEKKEKTSEKVDKCEKIYLGSQVERRDGEIERSSLTEEHGYPDSLPVPSSFPENSNKRKRHYCYTSQTSSSSIPQINTSLPNAVVHGLESLECKDLLEKLFPPQLQDKGDLDWLYPDRRSEEVGGEKRQRCGSDSISCSRSSASWPPRAEYLHQIDAYALPYMVPF